MRTPRQTKLRRALLSALAAVPETMMLDEATLMSDAARMVAPRPTTSELAVEIAAADQEKLIAGGADEDCVRWEINLRGRTWLAEHP